MVVFGKRGHDTMPSQERSKLFGEEVLANLSEVAAQVWTSSRNEKCPVGTALKTMPSGTNR